LDFETFWRTSWEIQKMLMELQFWKRIEELFYEDTGLGEATRCCLQCRFPSLKVEIPRSQEECVECVLSYMYGCFYCDFYIPRSNGEAGCALAQRIGMLRQAVGLMINLVPYEDEQGHARPHLGFMFLRKFPEEDHRRITEKFKIFGLKYRKRVWGKEFKYTQEVHQFFKLCYEEIAELVPRAEKAWDRRIPTLLSELPKELAPPKRF